jgi:hypothetical protein
VTCPATTMSAWRAARRTVLSAGVRWPSAPTARRADDLICSRSWRRAPGRRSAASLLASATVRAPGAGIRSRFRHGSRGAASLIAIDLRRRCRCGRITRRRIAPHRRTGSVCSANANAPTKAKCCSAAVPRCCSAGAAR